MQIPLSWLHTNTYFPHILWISWCVLYTMTVSLSIMTHIINPDSCQHWQLQRNAGSCLRVQFISGMQNVVADFKWSPVGKEETAPWYCESDVEPVVAGAHWSDHQSRTAIDHSEFLLPAAHPLGCMCLGYLVCTTALRLMSRCYWNSPASPPLQER